MKILVVDDDQRMVKTTCDILRIKGFEPVSAFSGEEALEKLELDKPDCVLMDIKMPGISGVEALKRMKAKYPSLPVILATAYAMDDLVEEAKSHGAYAVLTKPINFQMILAFLSLLHQDESVLVVDDDPNFCRTLKDVLALRGYRVETETEPSKVIGHMQDNYKLVVLLDIKLGNVDGTTVLQNIRDKFPTKPVVLVTGYRDEVASSIEKGLKIGAYACLYKPFETESLIRLIEEIRAKKYQEVLGGMKPSESHAHQNP
ncbi:MAG: response regulator [Methylococcaceae bacterium]|nr:response regulator [Methylococcaceae bacterium]